MKENEFDIQVRNLLLNAQESVSPEVWEGVVAGLERKRRAVPFRIWSFAGVAAAAAVAALVIFLRPTSSLPENPNHSNPIIISEAPASPVVQEETVPDETPAGASRRPAARLAQVQPFAQPSTPAPAVTPEPAPAPVPEVMPEVAPEASPETVPDVVPEPVEKKTATVSPEDQLALARLAQAEDARQGGRFTVSAFGNLQDKRRGNVPGDFARQHGAPLLPKEEGIYNGSPEVSFSLPFSAGIGLTYNFTPRWAVGVGFRYTNLSRTFVGDYVGVGFQYLQTDIDNHQHWVGIPLHVYYSIVNKGSWRVHVFGGGAADFLADNDFLVHGPQKDFHYHEKGVTPQWSGDLGLGVEFRITPFLGLYLDPSFRYYFRTDLQPRSLRTIQPLRFDIEAGVRFSFGQ